MSHTPHEIADEFPQDVQVVHRLKLEDSHFQKLAEDYHRVNREIHRIESEVEAASDERVEALKKQRLALLDDLGGIISRAKSAA